MNIIIDYLYSVSKHLLTLGPNGLFAQKQNKKKKELYAHN